MADEKNWEIHPALYDYILYYECSPKDWIAKRLPDVNSIDGKGITLSLIDWDNATMTMDTNGDWTKLGVNEVAWDPYVNYKIPLKQMDKNGWSNIFKDVFWKENCANKCANIACALLLFQISWQGYGKTSRANLVKTLKDNCDIKDYKFSGNNSYAGIADATNAYTDPMKAYNIMRQFVPKYYWNLAANKDKDWSNSLRKNLRIAWMRRHVMAFRPDGLYVEVGFCAKEMDYSKTVDEWESYAQSCVSNKRSGYKKILHWDGVTAEQIAAMNANIGNFSYTPSSFSSYSTGGSSSPTYSCFGVVNNMGDYTNYPDGNNIPQEKQNREEVWNTLIGGSYMQDKVRKCAELITTDKIKNEKPKSEND